MSWRKGSNASVETSGGSNGSRVAVSSKGVYPFALALRIRVVQIVCGIAAVVMGSVAAIEERKNFNLSLGVPAGAVTVLAAAWSVHRSVHRNAGGRRGGSWMARVLWLTAFSLHVTLLALATRTSHHRHEHGEIHTNNTSLAVAIVQGIVAVATLVTMALMGRLRYIYGPCPSGPPPRMDHCPRSTSHTAVSMVPLTSAYGCQTLTNDISKSEGNLSSENETMEITIADNKASFGDDKVSPKISAGDASPKPQQNPTSKDCEKMFNPKNILDKDTDKCIT